MAQATTDADQRVRYNFAPLDEELATGIDINKLTFLRLMVERGVMGPATAIRTPRVKVED